VQQLCTTLLGITGVEHNLLRKKVLLTDPIPYTVCVPSSLMWRPIFPKPVRPHTTWIACMGSWQAQGQFGSYRMSHKLLSARNGASSLRASPVQCSPPQNACMHGRCRTWGRCKHVLLYGLHRSCTCHACYLFIACFCWCMLYLLHVPCMGYDTYLLLLLQSPEPLTPAPPPPSFPASTLLLCKVYPDDQQGLGQSAVSLTTMLPWTVSMIRA